MLTNYKYTKATLGLSVTFVFNFEPFFNKEKHTYMHYKMNTICTITL